MVDLSQIERIQQLRAEGCTPKQIARALGLSLAEVGDLLLQAAGVGWEAHPPPVRCWVSPGWATGLTVDGHPDWPGVNDADSVSGGLAAVLVARRHRHDKVSVAGYLVDVYCLGVKDAIRPKVMDEQALGHFRRNFFAGFDAPPLPAPVELARELVFGAVDYAQHLGFPPHPDYTDAVGHLGPPATVSNIAFGCHGKPYFIQGPYDDAPRILRALDNKLGTNGYHFITEVPLDALV